MSVSMTAVEHTINRLGLKDDFGRAFTPSDVAMLVMAHRHKWLDFLQMVIHRPLNYNFLCMGAIRLLEIHGDVEAYEFIMSFIPDCRVEEFCTMFHQLNFVCFPSEKRVRFAV
jgi:hypothetical protein